MQELATDPGPTFPTALGIPHGDRGGGEEAEALAASTSRDLLEDWRGWLGQRTQPRDLFEQELLRRGDAHTAILT